MVYRGARDASLLELARSGFLRAVAKPAASASAPTTEVSPEVSTRSFAAPSTVADVPARATTCHRVATYRLRLDAEWRDDAMVVDAVVSQWDLCRFLRDRYAEKKEKSHPVLCDSREKKTTKNDAFHASLRELGMVSDGDDDKKHRRFSDSDQSVVTVTLRTSVLEAFSKMRAAGVSCVGVTTDAWSGVEDRGPLVGVVTATDFRVAFCGPGETRRLPDWIAGELLGSVDEFLYRIRTVRLFWERRATRGSTTENDERFSPSATPATTYLYSMGRDATFFEAVDALVSNRTHHVFVVDSFHGNAVRVVTPADVLRAICAPGRSALGWRYKEEDVKKKEKAFADGVRMTDAVGGCLGTLELCDDARRETGEGDAQVGFAGRFDDEM
jgi:CBS domain-containing protein